MRLVVLADIVRKWASIFVVLFIAMSLASPCSAIAGETKVWEITLDDYFSTVINLSCVERRSPDFGQCKIPSDKCKRFVSLVAKNCLGQAIATRKPKKHPRNMTQEELLAVIDNAAICTGRTVPVITYYVCPEQHESTWGGDHYEWIGKDNR